VKIGMRRTLPGIMSFVAKKIFLTKGVGKHRERLSSFELALRNAGIAACNIVRVSSIFPPNCKLISRSEGLKHIKPGQVAFTVISENSTKEPHRLIAASIGLALPGDKTMYGYLSEHHSFGETEEVAGEYDDERDAIRGRRQARLVDHGVGRGYPYRRRRLKKRSEEFRILPGAREKRAPF